MKKVSQLITKNTTLDFKQKKLKSFVCEDCQSEVDLIEMMNPATKKPFTFKKGCTCEEIRLGREALETYKKLHSKRLIDKFKKQSLIPKKLLSCTFDNYEPTNESQKEALEKSIDFVENFDPEESENMIFTGSYGLGKSHLSVSIIKTLILRGQTGIFISVPKLMTKIKTTFDTKDGMTESEIISALEKTDVLVLDDIGAENGTEWTESKLFEVIDNRQGKHTIFTTNLTGERLNEKVGDRNFSRIMHDTTVIKISGKDRRLQSWKV